MIIGDFIAFVVIVIVIALTVLIINKRETKVGELKRLRKENKELNTLVNSLDKAAYDEYAVTTNLFAGSVLDAIRRHNSNKENE